MRKLLCLFAVLLLVSPLFAGGGSQAAPATGSTAASGPVKLTYYEGFGRAAQGHSTLASHPCWVELQKRMNVEIEFRSPPIGNEIESFNLMIASREFPDIITYGWAGVVGGPGQYIQDKVIIPLNDVIDKWAPDLKKTFEKFPVARREATMDDGTFFVFPQVYSNLALAMYWGPLYRKDLVPKIPGLNPADMPANMETLDEWEKVLTLVKNSGLKGDSGRDIIPLGLCLDGSYHSGGLIVGAWGINTRFTQENSKAVYGPADPRYREYLNLMRKWFQMGLIDPEYPTNAANNTRVYDEKVLDNRVFLVMGAMGSASTRYMGLARPTNPAFTLATLKYPVLRKGEQPHLAFQTNQFTGVGAAITTACTNVEAAARVLNYDHTDEGYILANFGFEGQTFNWTPRTPAYVCDLPQSTRNAYPTYTEAITNSPEGYSRDIATGVVVRVGNFVGIKSPEFLEQRDYLPEQVGPLGRGMWMASSNKNRLPAVSATQDESVELARIMTEVNTYADEMTVKFITGVEPLNDAKWNEYISTIQRMNIARAIEITNAQIDRYNKRP